MMKMPTDTLREEHRTILRALALLTEAADRLASGHALPDGWWERAVEWLRTFADNHHDKEERCLFPALARAGVPPSGPVAVMLAEHEEGRRLVQAMESEQGTGRTEAARRYVQLLREHIDKENAVLFPLAEAVFDASTLQMLAQQFEAVEAEQGHDASTDRAEAEVEGLNSEYQSNHNSVS